MKHLFSTISLATVLAIASSATMARDNYYSNNPTFQDSARVTHVEPIYKTVRVSTPQRECWTETNNYNHRPQAKSYTSTIAGGILGGVLGNQFGGGSGKTAMTVAGTLLGGSLGNDYNNYSREKDRYGNQENCRVTERYREEQRADGYQVSYRYQGKNYSTYMDQRPGRTIPVDVSVRPSQHYY